MWCKDVLGGCLYMRLAGWGVSYGVGAGWMGEMAIFARDK